MKTYSIYRKGVMVLQVQAPNIYTAHAIAKEKLGIGIATSLS